jgi:hypothetical protein
MSTIFSLDGGYILNKNSAYQEAAPRWNPFREILRPEDQGILFPNALLPFNPAKKQYVFASIMHQISARYNRPK